MRAEVLKAIEELGRTDVKSMNHFHHLGYAGNMKIAILELLINNDNLQYDEATLLRERDGEYEQLERTCNLVEELEEKVDVLLQTEKSVLKDNYRVKSGMLALTKEKRALKKEGYRPTGGSDEPVRCENDKVDLLMSARTRVNQGSRIPKYRSQQEKVKSVLKHNGAASATQLKTIRQYKGSEDDEKIIPLTGKPKSKSACTLLNESEGYTTPVANMDPKGVNDHPSEPPLVGFSTSKSDDVHTTYLKKPREGGPRYNVSDTSDFIDEVPTIHLGEESCNTNADDRMTIHRQKQKPATDFSMFLGGKKSAPRKEMFAEQPKEKRSLMTPLRNFFKVRKGDQVEEIGEMPMKKEKPVEPRRSKIPVFRREKKKNKTEKTCQSKIPLFRRHPKEKNGLMTPLQNFFKVRKGDRVEKIGEMPKKQNKQVEPRHSKIPVFRQEKKKNKPENPCQSKIPLFRRHPTEKNGLMTPLQNFFKVRKGDRVEKISEMPMKKNKLVEPRHSKIPLFRRKRKRTNQKNHVNQGFPCSDILLRRRMG